MNIALFGYGKMGRMIEQLAVQRGHSIVQKIELDTEEIDYAHMDIAIDFSMPDAAFKNIVNCIEHGVPVLSGTTGWLHDYEAAVALCQEKKGAFIYASNFSLGVNLFFELNAHLAKLMKNVDHYQAAIEETHHTQKVDAPSGTAITLAEGIIEHTSYDNWKLNEGGASTLPIHSKRIGTTPGTHLIEYSSNVDTIEIKHTAHNREGFALGAVVAAEWLVNKTGVFTMKDVLGL